ncbi:MAG: dihydroneopterin aldolase [Bacteroidetes bacterium]|nr:dihydroneopterin aldolase [Bacteroidota bacterium]
MSETIIRFNKLKLFGFHGVHEFEKQNGNNFEIDLELFCKIQNSKSTDNLIDTINYEEVYKLILEKFNIKKFNLLEALSDQLAVEILNNFINVLKVKLILRKMNPVKMENLNSVEVEIIKERK